MQNRLQQYLDKRADLERWPLVAASTDAVDQVVVIPVLAEKDYVFRTLDSLARIPAAELCRTLVVCVVNNRALPFADAAQLEQNRETLERLDARVHKSEAGGEASLRFAYVDAASPGHELPEKGGVGLARKIGLDWGLLVLKDSPASCRLLFSLDADTLVEPNYLSAVRDHFEAHNGWAAAVAYAHPLDDPPDEVAAIVCYELFLRYHVMGLEYARSPYAFPTIGSTIVCRAEAYAAVGGMNQRQAGEDFYFLQQLAKTGRVDRVFTTTVHPSSRPSARVPFGTGMGVRRFLAGREAEYALYHPESYRILRDWLALVAANLDADAAPILASANDACPQLAAFLDREGFAETWTRLRHNAKDARQLHDQFHRWFDALKTIRLIHCLRDNGFPQQDMFESIATLLAWAGKRGFSLTSANMRDDVPRQIDLLHHLRMLARHEEELVNGRHSQLSK